MISFSSVPNSCPASPGPGSGASRRNIGADLQMAFNRSGLREEKQESVSFSIS